MTRVLKTFTLMTLLPWSRKHTSNAASVSQTHPQDNLVFPHRLPRHVLAARLECALWSFLAGDALAAPTHWYYGGFPQVQNDYPGGIQDYTKPVTQLPGSILNKSNLQGGGRSTNSSSRTDNKADMPSIVGEVILHGKQELWSPKKSIHYHATLARGENTLEVQLARVLMKSIVHNRGQFDPDHFRKAYMEFMTTPGSHNDTYASTCHRMFFRNLVHRQLPPEKCPDNDHHNVDTVDGLVLPTIVTLAVAAKEGFSIPQVQQQAASCASVTRQSQSLERTARAWSALLVHLLYREGTVEENVPRAAREAGVRGPRPTGPDQMTACYLDSAYPALLDGVLKYSTTGVASVWDALLANANTGGENVHRGSCLGAALGVQHDSLSDLGSDRLVKGLVPQEELQNEIQAFISAVLGPVDDPSDMECPTTP